MSAPDTHEVFKLLSHPLRVQILIALDGRTASPSELARELDGSLGSISYHFHRLHDAGILELVDVQMVRGTVEHRYTVKGLPQFRVPDGIAQPDALAALQLAAVAAACGGFDDDRSMLALQRVTVDQQGRAAIAAEIEALRERVEPIVAASRERLSKAGANAVEHKLTAMTLIV